jgi:hypothetical protein
MSQVARTTASAVRVKSPPMQHASALLAAAVAQASFREAIVCMKVYTMCRQLRAYGGASTTGDITCATVMLVGAQLGLRVPRSSCCSFWVVRCKRGDSNW